MVGVLGCVAFFNAGARPTLAGLALVLAVWPFPAVIAGVVGALAVGLAVVREAPAWATWARLGVAWAFAGVAVYAYGLSLAGRNVFFLWQGDERCVAPGEGGVSGTWSAFPLSDTTCGRELVPWWISPVACGCALLFVLCVAGMARALRCGEDVRVSCGVIGKR